MKTRISDTPGFNAGEYISQKLAEHAHEPILLLLSGGSAFAVLEHIAPDSLGPHVTIIMADERFTASPEGNNFMQLKTTSLYAHAQERGVQFISSVPAHPQSLEDFVAEMRESIEKYLAQHLHGYSLGIFGIGEDGHTAGIFAQPEKDFAATYRTDEYYTASTQKLHAYSQRTTVTPTFIEEILDDVVLYAVGTNKCENILDYMYKRTFKEHEIPALIPASHPQSVLFTDCPTLTPIYQGGYAQK